MKYTFKKLVRQCTGTNFMDSGGDNGRHWQQKLPKDKIILSISEWSGKKHPSATIPLHMHLAACLNIDVKLTKVVRKGLEIHNDNMFEVSEYMQNKTGLKQCMLDYTYNWENDLSQDFQFVLLTENGDIYGKNPLILVQTHNGADARGGFSDVVACTPVNEVTDFLNVTVGWSFAWCKDAKGAEVDAQSEDERFQPGYCSNPTYEFDKHIKKIIKVRPIKGSIVVLLENGLTAEAYPVAYHLN